MSKKVIKLIIFLAIVFLIIISVPVNAIEIIKKDKPSEPLYRFFTGKNFIVWKQNENKEDESFLSDDGISFKKITLPCNGIPIWGNGVYVLRNRILDNVPKEYNKYKRNSPIYILDSDFNIIDKYNFDGFIGKVIYSNGSFYYDYHMSKDGVNWFKTDITVDIGKSKNNIIGNNGNVFFANTFANSEVTYSLSWDNINFYKILYEGGDIRPRLIQNIYVNEKNKYSYDGIYWSNIDVDDKDFNINYSWIYENNLFIETFDKIYKMPMDIPRNVYIMLNDNILGFGTPPVIENNRLLVPMRFLLEQMGSKVNWNSDKQAIKVTNGDKTIVFTIDNEIAYVNNISKKMDIPAKIINNKTMLPLRFLSEELGFKVNWNTITRTAVIGR